MSRLLVIFVAVALAFLPTLVGGQSATPPPTETPCLSADASPTPLTTPTLSGSPATTPTATPTGSPTATPVVGASCTVAIIDNRFVEKTIKIAPGTTVIWTNQSTNPNSAHTVTADALGPDGKPIFDSGSDFEEPEEFLGPGESFMYTFETAGEFPYHCVIHGGPGGGGMSGTIVVE